MSVSRRDLLKGIAATSVVATTAACSSISSKGTAPAMSQDKNQNKTKKPNLLVIFPDECRTQSLGYMGMDKHTITPNINRMAREGVVLDQTISNFPLCTPARGMFMTGQYPYRNGIHGNCHTPEEGNFAGSDFGVELKANAICWSDVLKKQGYSLGYLGKWHLDCPKPPFVPSYNNPLGGRYWNDWTPPSHRHSFDWWYSYGTYDLHMNPIYWTNDTPREAPLKINQWSPEHEADMAIKYLRNEGGQYRSEEDPFALVVSMNPPHSPYDQVPEKYLERFKGKTSREMNDRQNVDWDKEYLEGYGPDFYKEYLAMINGVDEQIGRIVDELDRLNLAEDTLVVFFSDHGCCLGANGEPTKNVIYEESVRIPMIFRWKDNLMPIQDDLLFSIPDLFPTMLGLMGLDTEIPDTVEGTNYAKTVQGEKGDERATSQLYVKSPYGAPSYGKRGVRTDRYTLQATRKIGKPIEYLLFDNVADPYQMKNIANEHPDLVEQLVQTELMPWLEHTGDSWRPTEVPTSVLNAYT